MTADPPADPVRIVRIIDAPPDDVFRAWTEPEQIRRWWGPGEFTCPEADVDLRPGGTYRLAMQPTAVDGGTRVRFSLSCSPRGFARLMTPMVAKTMRSEVAQLERLREVLES